jgi:hypothetical protein
VALLALLDKEEFMSFGLLLTSEKPSCENKYLEDANARLIKPPRRLGTGLSLKILNLITVYLPR